MTDNLQQATGSVVDPDIAGVLALSASCRVGPVRLYLTRREHIHEVEWGGRPDKPIETAEGEMPIAPRRSFEKWVEKRYGYCRPWTQEQQHLALKVRLLLLRELRGYSGRQSD
jgi:light-regulated signal transduction histidine kinase (bacteriophytochrome)